MAEASIRTQWRVRAATTVQDCGLKDDQQLVYI